MILDHRIIAGITIFGMILDVLGALYLVYDLYGRKEGLLRKLTIAITYIFLGIFLGTLAMP